MNGGWVEWGNQAGGQNKKGKMENLLERKKQRKLWEIQEAAE